MRRLMVMALLALAVASCGEDERPVRSVTVAGGEDIRVRGDEYRFDPGRIVVRDGARELRITLVNVGRLAHNLTVMEDGREIAGLRSFPAGEERSFDVRLPAGAYRYVCTVADHAELGMTGELEVRR